MNDIKSRLDAMSGEGGSKFKYVVPLLKFNGNTGEFREVVKDGDIEAETGVDKPVKIVILKKRRIVSSYTKNLSYFTQEHNTVNDKLVLYKNTAGTITFDSVGYGPELKTKNPQLKTQEIVYAILNDKIVKMTIKGSNMVGYYDYLNSLQKEGIRSYEVETVINTTKQKNDSLGTTYFSMEFTKGAPSDLSKVEVAMKEVSDAIAKMDELSTKELVKRTGVASPVKVDTVEYPTDDINPDDIPF